MRAGCTGYQGFFYHFLDPETGAPLPRRRAVDRRHRAAAGRRALLPVATSTGATPREDEHPRARRLALRPRRLDLGRRSGRRRSATAGRRKSGHLPYDWRGYNEAMLLYLLALGSPTHPVAARRLVGLDGRLPLGRVPGAGAPRLRAALRPPVHPRLDRLPRHPDAYMREQRDRLLRELAPRRPRPARLRRWRNPGRLARLRAAPAGG